MGVNDVCSDSSVRSRPTSTIFSRKNASEAPRLILKGLDVLNLDEKYISRLCTLNLEWSRKIVNSGQIDVLYVVSRIVVSDLSSPATFPRMSALLVRRQRENETIK